MQHACRRIKLFLAGICAVLAFAAVRAGEQGQPVELLEAAKRYAAEEAIIESRIGEIVRVECRDGTSVRGTAVRIGSSLKIAPERRGIRLIHETTHKEIRRSLVEVVAVTLDDGTLIYTVPFESEPLLQDESRFLTSLEQQLQPLKADVWKLSRGDDPPPSEDAADSFVSLVKAEWPVAFARLDMPGLILLTDADEQLLRRLERHVTIALQDLHSLYRMPFNMDVWGGKAVVVIFGRHSSHERFVRKFWDGIEIDNAIGLCHHDDGRVVMTCTLGDDSAQCAYAVVHEVAHGYNYRHLSSVELPQWLDEGIAEFIAQKQFPDGGRMGSREWYSSSAAKHGAPFRLFAQRRLEAWEYANAFRIVKRLVETDPDRFRLLVRYLKEGTKISEAVGLAFGKTTDELAAW